MFGGKRVKADSNMHPDRNPLEKKTQKQIPPLPPPTKKKEKENRVRCDVQPPSCQSHYSSSHHARFDVLTHALGVVVVVMVVVGSAGRGVEGGDAVEVEHEVLPVAHRRVALVARDAHCEQTQSRAVTLGPHTSSGSIHSIQCN